MDLSSVIVPLKRTFERRVVTSAVGIALALDSRPRDLSLSTAPSTTPPNLLVRTSRDEGQHLNSAAQLISRSTSRALHQPSPPPSGE
jgi:hypothetical protein